MVMTNGINMLNNAEKIVKERITKLPKVQIKYSGLKESREKI